MLLKKLITYAKLTPLSDIKGETLVNHAVSSSDAVREGDVFFAIDGEKYDGNDYVREAIKNGACAVVTQRGRGSELLELGAYVLEASDVRSSLAYALDMQYGSPSASMKYIAVTGTNGKTTISHMLCRILCRCGNSCGLIGTCGSFIDGEPLTGCDVCSTVGMTTPEPEELYCILSEMRRRGAKYVILEASSHASVQGRLAPIRFCVSIFSNLTPEHLDFHKDMENYFCAKREIIRRSETAIVNADDIYGRRLISEKACQRIVSVSTTDFGCTYFASNVKLHGCDGISFLLCGEEKNMDCFLPIVGEFNVCNAMLAASAARSLGVPRACISAALSGFTGVAGRMQRVSGEGIRAKIFIDYAHTPDALMRLLATASQMKGDSGRILLLFGCGGDRDKSKRPKMGEIATSYADRVIVTTDNPRGESPQDIISDIVHGIPNGRKNYVVIPDRREAIRYVLKVAHKDDVVLLAGKGHEKYEITNNVKKPFDEEYEIRMAARASLGTEF